MFELSEYNASIDASQLALENIWKDEELNGFYPEERMKHILSLICVSVCARIQHEFKNVDLWGALFGDIRIRLNESLKVCNLCKKMIIDLTQNYLPHSINSWRSGLYKDKNLEALKRRLNEIFVIRSQV